MVDFTSGMDISSLIGKTISGKEFNDNFKDLSNRLIKLTNKTEIHNGFQFVSGENVDTIEFNPEGECKKGGIYFTDIDNFHIWLEYNDNVMKYCRRVVLPPDCKVYIEEDKFKADKIILGERVKIKDFEIWKDEDFCIRFLKNKGYTGIEYIRNPNEKVQLYAMEINAYAICYIKNPSEDIQLMSIQKYGADAFKYIQNPSVKIQLAAVKRDKFSIYHITDPCKEVLLEYEKQKEKDVIKFNEFSKESVKIAAVRQNGLMIQRVSNPSKNMILQAVRQNGCAIYYIKDPSEELKLEAVRQNGRAIKYIKDPSEEVQLEAVKQNVDAFKYILRNNEGKRITIPKEVQLEAFKQDWRVVEFMDYMRDNSILEIIVQNEDAKKYLDLKNNFQNIINSHAIKCFVGNKDSDLATV